MAPFLDERGRRLFTASEARAAGRGGVTAVTTATRVARSTIGRGLAELRGGRDDLGSRIRRPGGGRKPAARTMLSRLLPNVGPKLIRPHTSQSLSLLDRGLEVDHSTLNRWVLAYAPLIERRGRTFGAERMCERSIVTSPA